MSSRIREHRGAARAGGPTEPYLPGVPLYMPEAGWSEWLARLAQATNALIQRPAGTGGTGDITSVIAGTGLNGGGTAGDVTLNLTVPVPVSSGGTGAITAPAALTNLGAAPIASPLFTGDPRAPTPLTTDNDTSIATTAFVKAQSYQSGNQTITLSGDTSGSGTTAIPTTLATVNANVGTWNNVTINAKGLATAGSNVAYLTAVPAYTGDVTSPAGGTVNTLVTVNANVGTWNSITINAKGLATAGSNVAYLIANQTITLSGDATGSGTTAIPLTFATVNANVGTFQGITVNAKGLVTAASNQNYAPATGGSYLPLVGGTIGGGAPGSLIIGAPTAPSGGMLTGDLNVQRFFINGAPINTSGSFLPLAGGTISGSPGTLLINQNAAAFPNSLAIDGLRLQNADGSNTSFHLSSSWASALSQVVGQVSGGTAAVPTAVTSANTLLSLQGRGFNGTSWSGAAVHIGFATVTSPWTATDQSTRIVFNTTPVGSTTFAQVAQIAQGLTLGTQLANNTDNGRGTLICNMNTVPPPATYGGAHQFIGPDGAAFGIEMQSYGGGCAIYGRRGNGTAAAPTALLSGQGISNFQVYGRGATNWFGFRGMWAFNASENWTDTAQGTYFSIYTTPNGSTTSSAVVTIDSAGLHLTGVYYSNGSPVVYANAPNTGFVTIYDNSGAVTLFLGYLTDPTNYHRQTTHKFQSRAAADFCTIDSGGLHIASPYIFLGGATGVVNGVGGSILYGDANNMAIHLPTNSASLFIQNGSGSNVITLTASGTLTATNTVYTTGSLAGFSFADRTGTAPTSWTLYATGGTGQIWNNTSGGTTATHWNSVGDMFAHGQIAPNTNNALYCGYGGGAWLGVGAYAFNNASGRSEKTAIADLPPGCLARVAALDPQQYKWARAPDDDKTHWGFIADEVAAVMGDDFGGYTVQNGAELINYNELVACLWRAVQELAGRLTKLEVSA